MWQLDHACVSFGAAVALDDVSLTVGDGEIVVVLGPSGCGKSTMLRAVAGLQPLDSGRILADGADITHMAPHRRSIGMVFQDPTLFPHRNVAQNIEFGLRMRSMPTPARGERVAELLELVGLTGFEHRDVATLSGGEAQRVSLARSLAPRPSLLLLDEPLGALDRMLRDRLIGDLPRLLRSTGTAALQVTHDHDEAFSIADRIAVMANGSIHRVATPTDLASNPATVAVARFLGETNIIEDDGGGTRVRVIRRDAARVNPEGDLAAVVTGRCLRGGHHEVELATALGPLTFWLDPAPEVGESVMLSIDEARVAPLER